jgi:hypothetical protein
MSQGGHIVKPKGRRKTWAIMYRDPDGKCSGRVSLKRRVTRRPA